MSSGVPFVNITEAAAAQVLPDVNRRCVVMGCTSTGSGLTPFLSTYQAFMGAVGYGDTTDTAVNVALQPHRDGSNGPVIPCAVYTVAGDNPGTYGAVDDSGVTGTTTVDVDASVYPFGTYEARFLVTSGGTLGTDVILFKWSLDAGRHYSPVQRLSTSGAATKGSETSSAGAFPVSLANGDTFVGKVDQQAVATTLTISATAASKTGSGATYAAVTAGHQIVIDLDGAQYTVVFTGSEATQAAFHATINAVIAGFGLATNSAGQTKISTASKGSASTGAIVSADSDVLASLGLSVAAFTAGTGNVPNVAAVSASTFAALLTSTFTGGDAGSTGSAIGTDRVRWQTNTAGVSPKGVQFTSGTGVAKIAGFDNSEHNGTATAYGYTIAEGNVAFTFSAGDFNTNDIVAVRTYAPSPNGSTVQAAFTALAQSAIDFGVVALEFPVDAAMLSSISIGLNRLALFGKRPVCLIRSRIPDAETNETDADWVNSITADMLGQNDSRVEWNCRYGLITDPGTGRQYFRSTFACHVADTVAAPISLSPGMPAATNAAGEANVSLYDATGQLVGHDEGDPLSASAGILSDTDLGNRGVSDYMQTVPQFRGIPFSTLPYVLYGPTDAVKNVPMRRVASAIERDVAALVVPQFGGRVGIVTRGSQKLLTTPAVNSVHDLIFNALSARYQNDIQNPNAAPNDSTGLVQVYDVVTVDETGKVVIDVSIRPKMFGIVFGFNITLETSIGS